MTSSDSIWPKRLPVLSESQLKAREEFMKRWHELLPKKYGVIEKFNHGFPAQLPHKLGSKTLEIGAGLGEHSRYENLARQEYYVQEYREEFCKELRKSFPPARVFCGDIQTTQPWAAETFDRVIAIHVLEHLPNLPAALAEINRILVPGGFFDVVIPCEGGLAYSFARKISAQRFFEREFKQDYTPIIKSEHVNNCDEICLLLDEGFHEVKRKYFPLLIPVMNLNLCIGFRFTKKVKVEIQPS